MTDYQIVILLWSIALVTGLLWWLHYAELWPFHGGRLLVWPFKRKRLDPWIPKATGKACTEEQAAKLRRGVEAWDREREEMTAKCYEFVRKDRMTEGIYLTENGKAHECSTPDYTWKRGDTLNTVWLCPCGQKFKLVAREWKTKPIDPAYRRYYYVSKEQREGVLGRKLSYADVLKKGNTKREKVGPYLGHTASRMVPMTSEEIINADVSFSWEATE